MSMAADEKAHITFSDPIAIFTIILAAIGDFMIVVGLVFALIPIVGWPITFMAALMHYMCALIAAGFLFGGGYLHTLWAKLIIVLGVILPLPVITLAIVLSILLNNKFISFLATQAALAVATGGTGNVAGAAASVAGKAAVQTAGKAAVQTAGKAAVNVATKEAVQIGERAAVQSAEKTALQSAGEGATQAAGRTRMGRMEEYARNKIKNRLQEEIDSYGDNEWERGIPTYEDINKEIETPDTPTNNPAAQHPRTVDLRQNKEKGE